MTKEDLQVIKQIKQGDIDAFETVFRQFYGKLVNFATGILRDASLAEEQVQDVFTHLWEKKDLYREDIALFAYLLTATRNKCINIVNHRAVQKKYLSQTQIDYQAKILDYNYDDIEEERLEKIYAALALLPEKCRQVFELSRLQNLPHKTIASRLGISVKTVENQITKALKILRSELLANACLLFLIKLLP